MRKSETAGGQPPLENDTARLSVDRIRVRALEPATDAEIRARRQRITALEQQVGRGEYAIDNARLAEALTSEGAIRLH